MPIRRASDGSGTACFRGACSPCPLRAQCTTSRGGRTVAVGVHEASLAAARARQETPGWLSGYRAVRSRVERKVAHTTRRRHGGRVARVRGRLKVDADHNLLAASVNLARLATLGLHYTPTRWAGQRPRRGEAARDHCGRARDRGSRDRIDASPAHSPAAASRPGRQKRHFRLTPDRSGRASSLAPAS